MSANPIDKLERQLQDLIEGAFTRLFRRNINARDITLLLLRAMEDKAHIWLKQPRQDQSRPIYTPFTFTRITPRGFWRDIPIC